MHIKEKIKIKRYFLLVTISTLILFYFSHRTWTHLIVLTLISLAIAANQLLLTRGIVELSSSASSQEKINGKKIAAIFIGKFAILSLALVLGIQFMRDLVILPVLGYIVQLGILTLCLKRNTD